MQAPPDTVAPWLSDGMGDAWTLRPVQWRSLADAAADLAPSATMTRNAIVPVDGWSLLLSNGPLGTDVGMVPSLAARQLGCRAVRAVCVRDDEAMYPARIMELFGPDGSGPLLFGEPSPPQTTAANGCSKRLATPCHSSASISTSAADGRSGSQRTFYTTICVSSAYRSTSSPIGQDRGSSH